LSLVTCRIISWIRSQVSALRHHSAQSLLMYVLLYTVGQKTILCISSIRQIIKSVCVSVCHINELNALHSQFSTDLHQTCRQGRVPAGVIAYYFRWKSGMSMSAKPEVELIFTIATIKVRAYVSYVWYYFNVWYFIIHAHIWEKESLSLKYNIRTFLDLNYICSCKI